MIEQRKLPRFHLKLTNREDFIQLMKGEYLSLDDNHLRIAIWYDLYDFKNKMYLDSVRELLKTKEVFLVSKKTKDFCTTYTMYKKFFKIRLADDFSKYAKLEASGTGPSRKGGEGSIYAVLSMKKSELRKKKTSTLTKILKLTNIINIKFKFMLKSILKFIFDGYMYNECDF